VFSSVAPSSRRIVVLQRKSWLPAMNRNKLHAHCCARDPQTAPHLAVATALAVLLCAGAVSARADEPDRLSGKILFLAAASTADAAEEVRGEFARLHPEVSVRTSYAASSTLAQQVAAGAPADLFLSASGEWADFLADRNLVERRHDLLGNRLVIVIAADSSLRIADAADLAGDKIRRLALADPKSVPAGVYAKQALDKLGIWPKVSGKVAGAADVRQALHFVETGAADAGIVYATDAASSKKVRVVHELAADLSAPIRYPLVLVKHGGDRPAATAFYDFLRSEYAAGVFRRHGFVVPPSAAPPKP
jgi:molybdate transport system substrate-binding protein